LISKSLLAELAPDFVLAVASSVAKITDFPT